MYIALIIRNFEWNSKPEISFASICAFNFIILGSFKRSLRFLSIGLLSSINWLTGQRLIYLNHPPVDSAFTVQFIELGDSLRSFNQLESLGNVLREFIPEKGLYRYSLGYYGNRSQVESVLLTVRAAGFKDAFVREINANPTTSSETEDLSSTASVTTGKAIIDERINAIQPNSFKTEVAPDFISEGLSDPKEKGKVRINMLYTGKSFGVLGKTRFQSEHEVVTGYAVENDIKFKLVSHASWRANGLTVFLPSNEPKGEELELILDKRNQWEVFGRTKALMTHNVLMFQDPDRTEIDMLNIFLNSPHQGVSFPETKPVQINLYRTYIYDDQECFIVEESDAEWPSNREYWSIGEINRVDFGKKGRLFELPTNQGSFGHRASILKKLKSEITASDGYVIIIDMGHRNADFDISKVQRSKLDFSGLDSLGYSILMPYDFEFLIGADSLHLIINEHPSLTLLASNVTSPKFPGLFLPYKIIEIEGVKIGLLALVDPTMEFNLPSKILEDFKFEEFISAANKTVGKLQESKSDIIIALSNMKNSDNARLSENVKGIHLVTANFTEQAMGWTSTKEITINQETRQGLRAPYDISALRDFGIEIGRTELNIEVGDSIFGAKLLSIREQNYKITDRIESDHALMTELIKGLPEISKERGELLFPAFLDVIEQNPNLENFDETTRLGRISKSLWESFLARILANEAPAEVSIIRKIPTFLPLIGKLHEREVMNWLWFEDEIVMLDLKGRDIKRLLEADRDKTLVTSGIEAIRSPFGMLYKIMGRPVQDDVYYRVATTNVITNGVFKENFRMSLRQSSHFKVMESGALKGTKEGEVIPLRDYILLNLRKIRSFGKGKDYHRRIADILEPKLPYPRLFAFNFDHPTLWTSLNKIYKGSGYEAIPESRITSGNSFVIGAEGGFISTLDMEKADLSFGLRLAFAQQSLDIGEGLTQKTENVDDIVINITYRYKGFKKVVFHPYARLEYDSEFTATVNRNTGLRNPKQQILRNIIGFAKGFTVKWPVLELGLTAENDFGNSNYQYGLQGRSLGRFPLDKNWNVIYSLTNNFNYFLPNKNDTERDLSFKYNMIHELWIPLFGDVSLSLSADLFFFRGKLEINNDPGLSMFTKVGLSYNRLWKPRFQTLF